MKWTTFINTLQDTKIYGGWWNEMNHCSKLWIPTILVLCYDFFCKLYPFFMKAQTFWMKLERELYLLSVFKLKISQQFLYSL